MSVIAAAVVTTAVAGAYSANKASNASAAATAAQRDAAAEQAALTQEQFEWNKQIYERDTAPMQKRQQELQEKVAADAMARAAKQDKLADEQKEYYDTTFKPIEQKVAKDAMEYDSADNVALRSGIAGANVNQQFSNVRGQSARLAGRYGLGSTAFSGPAGSSERAQALGAAGAQTGAAFDTMDKGIQLRAGAANFGRNMTNTALAGFNGANSSSGVAGNAANAALNGTITATNGMNNAYNTMFNNTGAVANRISDAYTADAARFNGIASGLGNFAGGLTKEMGGYGALFSKVGGLFG